MLKEHELLLLFQRCKFSEKAQAEIKRIRSSEPSRRVRSARGNMSGGYPSAIMGFNIQFESHEDELPFIYQLEHDEDVLEYYDQPPFIKLSYTMWDKNGKEKRVGFNYTPDFFIIKKDSAGWVECKTEEELQRLVVNYPERYMQGEDGQWLCPPGKEHANQFGFFFQVVSSASINRIFKRNIVYLDQYLRDENCSANQEAAKQVLHIVKEEPGITLDELRQHADKASSDDINILIAKEMIYFNLYNAPLAEPRYARLYQDKDMADAFSIMVETPFSLPASVGVIRVAPETVVLWDNKPWKIVNLGETKVTLISEDERQAVAELLYERFYGLINHGALTGLKNEAQKEMDVGKARELLTGADSEDRKVANYRHGIVMSILQKEASAGDFVESERTVWNWVSWYRRAQKLHGCGYVGLLPKTKDRGNRGRKIGEDTLKLIEEFIKNDYQNLKQMNKASVYAKFQLKCEDDHVPETSYKIFIREIKKRSGYGQTRKRQGRKAAYNEKPWFWELEYKTSRHGDRPWEIGHIDHTQLEIELIHSETKKNLGRPWVTFLTDAYSRRILAIYLTFDKPSYRSCMMVLRECVRRHNRLPQIMIYDGGAEFHSTYFESLLARYECTRKQRPASEPRFGSVCERLFGTVNTQFIHNLLGNTQIMKNVRQMTKDVNPKGIAIWTLESFYRLLCLWCYDFYDNREHPALGQTPAEAFVSGILVHGARNHMRIEYNDDFIKDTFPTTIKGTAKVGKQSGLIKINYISYWTKAFDHPEVRGTEVEVRYDPFDASVAYTYVNKKWERCVSDYRHDFKGRSEREIQLASTELRKRNQRHGQRFNISQKQLALFLRSPEAEEILLIQNLRDSEAKYVLTTINAIPTQEVNDNDAGWPTQVLNAHRPVSVLDTSMETQKRVRNLKIYEDY